MHIAILSSGEGWHVQDLLRAGRDLRYQLSVAPFPSLRGWAGRPGRAVEAAVGAAPAVEPLELTRVDRVLVRIVPPGSLEQVVFRMDALHRLAATGVPVINPAGAVETAVDKYLATAKLEAAGLPVPPTAACETAAAALEAFAELGGDVVVKPMFGSQGRGMMRVSDPDLAERAFGALELLGSVIYLQPWLAHDGWDLRAFVIGRRVIAAMKRSSRTDWRTNVARGAKAEAVEIGDSDAELAVRAAAAVGAKVAGVDLLPVGSRRYVLEVNAVPGWQALATASRRDIAAEVLRFVAGPQ